jgi:hypothetical protein
LRSDFIIEFLEGGNECESERENGDMEKRPTEAAEADQPRISPAPSVVAFVVVIWLFLSRARGPQSPEIWGAMHDALRA